MKKIISISLITVLLMLSLVSCIDISGFGGTGAQNDGTLTAEYVYSLAKEEGYTGTLADFIDEFRGEEGEDGVGIAGVALNDKSHLIITLTNGAVIDCGEVGTGTGTAGGAISIGENGNWFIDGEDTGTKAAPDEPSKWHTGNGAPSALLGNVGDLYLNKVNGDIYEKKASFWELISNISGDGIVNNEGDNYDVTINAGSDSSAAKYAAAKGLLSAVMIEAYYSTGGSALQGVSYGSGVIYKLDKTTGDAYIITNHHVVYRSVLAQENNLSSEINLYLYGLEYVNFAIPAEYVGGSLNYDIAVLRVKGSELLKTSAATAVDIRDSRDVRVLDTAIAIGNPISGNISVTLGSVNVESEWIEMIAVDGKTSVLYRVMRFDTPVNSGNSGGGIFDINGKLIGIVNAKEVGDIENVGYAVPSNLAVAVAENIIRNCEDKENSKLIRCTIGITIALSDVKVDYDETTGLINITKTCVVSEIMTGSVAELGIMVDDVLLSFEIDGVTYEINNTYDGQEALLYATADSEVYMNVLRGNEQKRVQLHLTEKNFAPID